MTLHNGAPCSAYAPEIGASEPRDLISGFEHAPAARGAATGSGAAGCWRAAGGLGRVGRDDQDVTIRAVGAVGSVRAIMPGCAATSATATIATIACRSNSNRYGIVHRHTGQINSCDINAPKPAPSSICSETEGY